MLTRNIKRHSGILVLLMALGAAAFCPLVRGADLTIDDGVVVKFGPDAGIVVRDSLQTGKQTIFTSIQDDSALGQTGVSPGLPTAGDWRGIRFEASAVGANQKLNDSTLRFGGFGALEVRKTSPNFFYVVVKEALIGIRVIDGAAPHFEGLSLTGNATGMEVDADSAPVITKSQILGNTGIGITNHTPATIVQATGNWWGHASGPKDPVANAAGQGDAVSTGVNYSLWAKVVPLINPQLSVANNVYFTEQPEVTLNLYCVNAIEYRLAENANFTGIAFVPMAASVPFTLSAGDGVKQISVQYRSIDGNLVTVSLPQGVLFDTQGPSLTVTNPAADSFITKSINIDANATDPAGVARVEIYVDDLLKFADAASPYGFFWDLTSVADGAHAIKLVAYDAVGHSTTDTRTVSVAQAAPPPPDTAGPATGNIKLAATGLIEGSTITKSGVLAVSASDPSGISRIEFLIDGLLFGTDTNGADGFSAFLDINSVTDGSHILTIRAFDSLNNMSTVALTVTVALAAPAAPTIAKPTGGFLTNQTQVTVSGVAEKLTQVQAYNNGLLVAGPVNIDAAGNFSLPVTLANGVNPLQAAALNRGGTGPLSTEVLVTLDASIPAAPLGLTAIAQAAGKVHLSWTKPADGSVAGYHVYRSPLAFNAVTEATKANTNLITATVFDDLPTTDGIYYYRVVAANTLGTISDPSSPASALSDHIQPQALAIGYAPTGKTDPATGRIAVGRVNLTVTVSEPLAAIPFLSIAPQNGVPIAVELTRVTDTEYRGGFDITPITPSGTAFAVFSARDLVGNRGTDIISGNSIKIDAKGPSVTALSVTPAAPIKNDAASPAVVNISLSLDEALKSGIALQLAYLRGVSTTPITITNPTQTGALTWKASFTLPADLGQTAPETFKFTYSGADDLDNLSTDILAPNSFQVYQGALPPVGVPTGLAAQAQPGGKVKLSWNPVTGAAAYQLYRQGPSDTALIPYQRVTTGMEYLDATTADGLYRYAVASLRLENGQEALGDLTAAVEVTADATSPTAPQNFQLAVTSIGMQATWQASASTDVVSYALYRASGTSITSTVGLTPIKTGIKATTAIDPAPSLTDHVYAVTALDAAGNESLVSNSSLLNVALLPVSTLTIVQSGADMPVVTWTHNGATIAGYDVYLGADASKVKLNGTRLTTKSYTDTGYTNDERRYTVVAVDNDNSEIGRTLTLPKLSSQLVAGAPIKRGLMNRLQYQVTNLGENAVGNITLRLKIGVRDYSSEVFNLAAGESKLVPVVVGGFADIPNLAPITTTLEVNPNEGESAKIVRTAEVAAQDGALVVNIATESFTRGATGKVRFTIENTSDVDIEILTATATGNNPSTDIRYKLLDKDGNVLSTQSFKQMLGANVITLASGQTIARLAPGASFTSDLTDVSVPSSAPNDITLQLDIDRLFYHLGSPEAVSITGLTGRKAASLMDTVYYGEISNITPVNSFGDQDVVITGRAIARATTQPLATVPLKLVFNVNGFERKFDVFTDATSSFTYTFKPTAADGGVYLVSILHPDMFERPNHGQFVINSLTLQYASYKLTNPRNYPFTIKVRAQAGEGTQATNLRFVYQASDQTGGILPAGVTVTPAAPIALSSKQSGDLAITVSGDNSAAETGSFIVKAYADERGADPVGVLRVDFHFTDAKPALFASPSFIETGLARGGSVTEQLTLENRGFAEAQNITLTLLNTDGTPAPSWIYLMSEGNINTLAIGEKRTLDIAIAPPETFAEGIYSFKLRIASANTNGGDIPVFVSITQSGVGNVLFKASDIYTGTLNTAGGFVAGLAGARITLQNETVISVTQTLTTDSLGEAYFTDLPAGRYKFRATASNHQEVIGRLTIKPGVTATQDVFLDYNLVTVEWSVTEITLQDKYEITLSATFETEVPAPVIVMEPLSVTLPTLAPGDVFYGEIILTNYGLIRADTVHFTPPPGDANFRFEFLAQVPATLEAKQRVTLPYRVVSLASLDQPAGTATGGGCNAWQQSAITSCTFKCANGVESTNCRASTSWFYVYGNCGLNPPAIDGGASGPGATGGDMASDGPGYTPLPGAPPCKGCKKPECCKRGSGGDGSG